jgi:hypothetical protein
MSSPNPVVVNGSGRKPQIDYVTKDYDGFRQAMLSQIPLLLPNWQSRSESDFGVVLIELFAYVADILSYYQDRIANEAYLSTATQRRSITELLRLVGYQIDPGLGASVFVHFDVTSDVTLSGASLPYRLKTAGLPGQTDQTFEITQPFSLKAVNSRIALAAVSALPAGLTSVVVSRAAHALAAGDRVYLQEQGTNRRSPPLQVVSVTAAAGTNDTIAWLPPLPESYDPASTDLKGNNILATQGETVANEPVTVGDGTPAQDMTLTRRPVTHLLKVGTLQQRRSKAEVHVLVDGLEWDQVDSLFSSGPSDLHYFTTVDENDALTIHFGTGARGAVPPAGAQVQAIYRVGLGSAGNVRADSLTIPLSSVPQITGITNPFEASGGADRESTAEARISGPGFVIAQDRAVTLQDYELLARAFPGVGKAKARVGLRGGYKVVQVYIAPQSPTSFPPPFAASSLRDALKAALEARQPVNRMAGVDVLNPVYVPVDIAVDLYATSQANTAQVLSDARAALESLVDFEQRDFGQPVRVGEIFSVLYPIAGVSYALLKRLARGGANGGTGPGDCGFADVPIADNELAYQGLLTINVLGGV